MNLPRLTLTNPRRTAVLAVVVALAVLVPSLGLTASYAYAGDVPRGTSVLGIDVGAMSHEEAVSALEAGLAEHAEALAGPVDLQVGEELTQLDPAEVELAVDVEATVTEAAEGSLNPIPALFGSREVAPVVTVNAERVEEELAGLSEDLGELMTMPEIRFEGTEPVPVYPEPGLGISAESAAAALTTGWPRLEGQGGQWRQPTVIAIPLVEINPVTTAEDVDRLVAELAEPAVAAPVTVSTDAGDVEVSPEAIAKSLRLTANGDGEIIPKVNKKALRKAIRDQLASVETTPEDATVVLESGEPTVVKGRKGTRVDVGALAGELLSVLPNPSPRTVEAELQEAKPEFTTKDAEDLQITEQVSTFTTNFDGGLDSPRSQNIVGVADLVDGAIVKPGEVFSLNGHTGERGYDQGFQDAPVIIGGKLVPAVGGGISQFTTTLFNASYYAGLEDVEHHPHSYYYSRYPAVIESTIFYPDLDMKFRNNTDYGILIKTSYTNDSVTVTMWGTKVWDKITTEYDPKRNITKPKTQYLEPGPDCIATVGIDGFTQDAWRVFHRGGQEVEREKFTWTYDAQPEFLCEEEPEDDR